MGHVVRQLLLAHGHHGVVKDRGVKTLLRLVTLEVLKWVHGLLTPVDAIIVIILVRLNRIFLVFVHDQFLLHRQARQYLVLLTAGVFIGELLA